MIFHKRLLVRQVESAAIGRRRTLRVIAGVMAGLFATIMAAWATPIRSTFYANAPINTTKPYYHSGGVPQGTYQQVMGDYTFDAPDPTSGAWDIYDPNNPLHPIYASQNQPNGWRVDFWINVAYEYAGVGYYLVNYSYRVIAPANFPLAQNLEVRYYAKPSSKLGSDMFTEGTKALLNGRLLGLGPDCREGGYSSHFDVVAP